jgi:Zn-dependent M28 family amino/carboxypeptidase
MVERCRQAQRRGASGCLVIARTPLREDMEEMADAGVGELLSDYPVLQLRRETARRLFRGGVPPPESGAARGRAMGNVSLSIPASVDPARPLANVIGAWRGRDRALRDEWVVLSAHLDHLGTAGKATYWGADDNASGVAVVNAVAQALAGLGQRPRRSIMFALWNGEECGLLGARHYVDEPLVPLERTVGVLQLDMVGVGQTRAFLTSARRKPAPMFMLFERAARSLQLGLPSDDVTAISDHVPFVRAGVPAMVVTTAGRHPHWHTVGDRPEQVLPEALENCARLVALTVWRAANEGSELPDLAERPSEASRVR